MIQITKELLETHVILETPLKDLGLPVSIYKLLAVSGCSTALDVCLLFPDAINDIYRLGAKSISTIKGCLYDLGIDVETITEPLVKTRNGRLYSEDVYRAKEEIRRG